MFKCSKNILKVLHINIVYVYHIYLRFSQSFIATLWLKSYVVFSCLLHIKVESLCRTSSWTSIQNGFFLFSRLLFITLWLFTSHLTVYIDSSPYFAHRSVFFFKAKKKCNKWNCEHSFDVQKHLLWTFRKWTHSYLSARRHLLVTFSGPKNWD